MDTIKVHHQHEEGSWAYACLREKTLQRNQNEPR